MDRLISFNQRTSGKYTDKNGKVEIMSGSKELPPHMSEFVEFVGKIKPGATLHATIHYDGKRVDYTKNSDEFREQLKKIKQRVDSGWNDKSDWFDFSIAVYGV
jgi:hypothetical protein